ncbi:MAG: thioredoxin-disulfide reductase [Candidatus Nanoarchaeia archaeon]|nr:thioredoxin-disulfide reductase [Candidatus Nanoarchaeia archaeon]
MDYDVIIIGSGPAGLTAGIYSARADLKVLILEGEQPGGQLTTTTEVENFPGFPEGIMGPELMNRMRTQAQKFGAETKFELVTSVDFSKKPFEIKTSEEVYLGNSVIIATGSRARYLGLESESRLKGRGVSACATCDGFFFKGKEIVVVGGGDSAMEEANFLTKFASKVTIIHHSENFKASAIMLDRCKANPKIDFLMNKEIVEVLGENSVTGLKLKDSKTSEVEEFKTEGLFLAIGHIPNTGLFKDKLEMEKEYIVTNDTKTSVEGVFACGDVQDRKRYWQAITSAGSGCIASLEAQKYLSHGN